jgi:gentisate 1,2-dioxygenase
MAMNVSFTEFHPDKQQPLLVPDDFSSRRYQGGIVRPVSDRQPRSVALGRYKWGLTKQALNGLSEFEPDSVEGFAIEYINPSNGKDANNRIGARMQKLPPQFQGKAHRHVHSNVYHVHKGQGYTVMNGTRFDWSEGDFFAVPAWTWHEHTNTSSADEAFLFSTNDLPIMEAFDFERQEAYIENNGHQDIKDVFNPILP